MDLVGFRGVNLPLINVQSLSKCSLMVNLKKGTSFVGIDAFDSKDINLRSSNVPPLPNQNFAFLS